MFNILINTNNYKAIAVNKIKYNQIKDPTSDVKLNYL
jgi:hypothetical protein